MTTAHHRHLQQQQHEEGSGLLLQESDAAAATAPHESSPLVLIRHFSMQDDEEEEYRHHQEHVFALPFLKRIRHSTSFAIILAAVLLLLLAVIISLRHHYPRHVVVPIEHAQETLLDIGENGLRIWYRTWGNRRNGIPVLFVHGGPGNAIADYHNGNARFFSPSQYFVVEVDQRGTGNSQPSVRDDWHNMKFYKDISIDKMSHDFELVRMSLGIDRWLVFGGSWGSTLSLNYGIHYPERCLGLILRGIYLNTVPEFNAVFSRRPYENNPKRLAEFDTWFELAAQDAIDAGEAPLDPNDAERFFRIYERMIESGNRRAIWHYHVFENNLMETDPRNLLDPDVIEEATLPEAQSVAFFETRLFLHGTFEEPVDLLSRVDRFKMVPHIWICQGRRDEVCPVQYAHKLVDTLQAVDVPYTARFLDAGHEDTDIVIAACLKESLHEFTKGVVPSSL